MGMTLRSHLITLVLVAVLPLLVFSAIVVGLAADSERDATERGLRSTARAVGTSVDHAIDNAIGALTVLASSELLDFGNLAEFHRVAARAIESQHGWLSVAVVDRNGNIHIPQVGTVTVGGLRYQDLNGFLRTAIGRARRRKATRLECADVEWAAVEIRNEYRRILDKEDIKLLRRVSENNRLEYSEQLRPLLQLLALLEYRDEDNWCDVHPVLRKLLDD